MTRRFALAATLALLTLSTTTGCRRRSRARGGPTPLVVRVPHATAPIVIDGEPDEVAWRDAARTGPFVGVDGAPVHPHSEARISWDDRTIFLVLYAADEDIRATHANPDGPTWLDDAFHIQLDKDGTAYSLDVSASGVLTDGRRLPGETAFDYAWQSGATIAHDIDGTLNDPSDDDEEWIIEMAIPLASLGVRAERGERLRFSAHRCDTPKKGVRVCGSFGERGRATILQLE